MTIRTALQTINAVILIKCIKHTWNALATKKKIREF